MFNRICIVVVALSWIAVPQTLLAHDVFQDVLKEEYLLRSFSCKTCHAEKDKKLRTPFAERIFVQMKQNNFSAKFAAAERADEEAKKSDPESVGKDKGAVHELEKVMSIEFRKAFEVVAQQKMSIDEMLREGLLAGARLDTKKIAAMKARKQMPENKDGSGNDASGQTP